MINVIAISKAIRKALDIIDAVLAAAELDKDPAMVQKRVELNDKLRSPATATEAIDAIEAVGPFAQDNMCLSRHDDEILPLLKEAKDEVLASQAQAAQPPADGDQNYFPEDTDE